MAERCEKYPSLDRRYCSHCQGTETGTQENPTFSVHEHFDDPLGYPVVEILKNGGPIHPYDSHFRLGRRKIEMLLTCLPAFKEFGWCTEEERLRFNPRTFEDPTLKIGVKVTVQMYPDFETSSGQWVDRPYLRLEAFPPDQSHLGLGMMKCRAVWSVQDDLRRWLLRQIVTSMNPRQREKFIQSLHELSEERLELLATALGPY